MFVALVLICNVDAGCMVMQNRALHASENDCLVAVAELFNSESFQYAIKETNAEVSNIQCVDLTPPAKV